MSADVQTDIAKLREVCLDRIRNDLAVHGEPQSAVAWMRTDGDVFWLEEDDERDADERHEYFARSLDRVQRADGFRASAFVIHGYKELPGGGHLPAVGVHTYHRLTQSASTFWAITDDETLIDADDEALALPAEMTAREFLLMLARFVLAFLIAGAAAGVYRLQSQSGDLMPSRTIAAAAILSFAAPFYWTANRPWWHPVAYSASVTAGLLGATFLL